MVSSASSVYIEYAYEDAFGGGATTSFPMNFGKEVKASSVEFKNNQQPLGQLYSPEVECFAYGKNEGKVSMEYVLSNPWFFESILDSVDSSLDSGTLYAHEWDSTPTLAGSTIKAINSMALRFGMDVTTDDFIRLPVGVVCPTLSLKMALNETVKVSQELIWGEETVNSTFAEPDATSLAGESPYTFVNALITSPLTGATLATIQSFDLNINSNAELVYEFNSANSVEAFRKILELTGKVGITLKDPTMLNSVYSRAEAANDMVITLDNKLATNAERKIVITLTGISFSSHNTSGIEPGQLVIENIDFQAKSINVIATNEATVLPDSV